MVSYFWIFLKIGFNQEAKQDPVLPRTIQHVLFIYSASAVVAKCSVHSYAVLWMYYKVFWHSHSFKHGVIIYFKVLVLCKLMNPSHCLNRSGVRVKSWDDVRSSSVPYLGRRGAPINTLWNHPNTNEKHPDHLFSCGQFWFLAQLIHESSN